MTGRAHMGGWGLEGDLKKKKSRGANERAEEERGGQEVGRRCLWPRVRQLVSVMGVYFNSWVQHKHVHTRPFAVPSPSFIFQLDYILSVSFVRFSLFPFPLTSLNKHTWCLAYSRPHMGSQLFKHNSTTSILPGTLQSSHISIFLPLRLSLCSALLHVYFTSIVASTNVVQNIVQSKGRGSTLTLQAELQDVNE